MRKSDLSLDQSVVDAGCSCWRSWRWSRLQQEHLHGTYSEWWTKLCMHPSDTSVVR